MKRVLLLGDGKTDAGNYRAAPRTCTPTIEAKDFGVIHVLLDRWLRGPGQIADFEFVWPLPRKGGWRSGWNGLASDLRGEPHARHVQGEEALRPYGVRHRVDLVVLVCDSEHDDLAKVEAGLCRSASRYCQLAPIVVGVAVPCTEAWLLVRPGTPGDCAPLKASLDVTGLPDKRRHAKLLQIDRLHRNVPEFRALAEAVAAALR